MKKTILIFIGSYLPSQSSGGAIRTIVNMVEYLGDEFNFKIITRDRDFGDNKPFDNIKLNEWNNRKNCQVFYLAKKQSLKKIINDTDFDIYYLNSFFDYHFSIKVILLKLFSCIKEKKIILAPRGEFMKGALATRTLKKRLYISFARLVSIYKDIIWHASSDSEAVEIKREMGANIETRIALDVPDYSLLEKKFERKHIKEKGKLNILFISVIVPKKNLKFAIEVLNKVEGDFTFDIFGPIKDEQYWKECLNAINPKIKAKITYKGEINNSEIHNVYPNYDLFFFPTLGENFGHVIWESLAFGCLVLTTNTTPWNRLEEKNAGWNIHLNDFKSFYEKVQSLVDFEENEYKKFVDGAFDYANSFNKYKTLKNNLDLFN